MAKGKKKATTPKKKKKEEGGQLDPEQVKSAEDNPEGAEGAVLDDIFGVGEDEPEIISGEDEDVEEPEEIEVPDPYLIDEHIAVKPTLKKAGEDDEEEEVEEEPEEGKKKKKPTQAAEEEEEETPTSLDKATLMEFLPEKFRGEDLTESLKKWQGSYGELESRQDRLESENADNQRMIREMARPRRPVTPEKPKTSGQEATLTEDDEAILNAALADMDILEDPITPFKKVFALALQKARNESMNSVANYDAMVSRREQFNRFKAEHSDFEDLKPEMLEIVTVDPSLDNPAMVEVVYKRAQDLKSMREAKQAAKATESVLGSEGIKDLISQVREETLREAQEAAKKREAELLSRISGGQAVKGTLSGRTAPSPTVKDRVGKGRKKVKVIHTDHGDYTVDDDEVAGIITAEGYDEGSHLLNL
jgi:hypothetical protein